MCGERCDRARRNAAASDVRAPGMLDALQTLAAGYEFEYRGRYFRIAESGRIAHAFIEEIDRHIRDARDLVEAAGTDAVDAFFVFLNLLKGKAQQVAQPFLTHTDQHATQSYAITDMRVGRVGTLFRQSCRAPAPHVRVTGACGGRKALIRIFL